MISITLAFVLATALAMLFRHTRPLGILGVFVLVVLSPVIFGGLLLVAGVIYFFVRRRRGVGVAPRRLPRLD